ncbi:AMP-binding protein [Nocardia sp. BSTN01]|uniref:AMP-binding protein n=1 Tax=Nocardia sp. BSTN01 TaxID=2783665 RepID=UPI0035CCF326
MNATLSLASILAEPARRRPDHVALIEGDRRLTFAELWRAARQQAGALIVQRSPLDTAVVFYTSGTTGRPKGAELSHLNMVMCATVNAFDANDVHRDDIALGALPLFHVFGQTVSMNSTWRVGATLVLMPRFTAPEAIRLMVTERVNTFHGVPTMYHGLIDAAADAGELPALRLCISGGAALPLPVLERFEEVFDAQILEGYGLSETSPTAAVNQPVFGPRAGTVGHPVWGVDVEIAAVGDAGIVQRVHRQSGGERAGRGRRLVPHRRPRRARRAGLSADRRPDQGDDHPRRIQRLSHRGGGGAAAASEDRAGGGDRGAGRELWRGDRRGRRARR